MPKQCELCNAAKACLKRPKTLQHICQTCFFHVFETEIHNTIIDHQLFARGETVAIAASGGKGSSSTVFYGRIDGRMSRFDRVGTCNEVIE